MRVIWGLWVAMPMVWLSPVVNVGNIQMKGLAHPSGNSGSVGYVASDGAIAQIFPDISDPTIQRLLLAEELLNLGLTEAGMTLYEQEVRRLQEHGELLSAANLLTNIASGFALRGQLPEAVIYYQRSLALYREQSVTPTAGLEPLFASLETANALGALALALGQADLALASYAEAVAIAESAGMPEISVRSIVGMGLAYGASGQFEQALSTYEQALMLDQAGGVTAETIRVWNRIGLLHQAQGDLESALAAYEQGLQPTPAPRDLIAQMVTLENISRLYQVQGQVAASEEYAQQAATILTGLLENGLNPDIPMDGVPLHQLIVLVDVGEYYLAEQQFAEAATYFERAVAIAQASGDDYAELDTLGRIILAYTRLAQIEQAIPYQQHTIEVFQEMGLSENTSTALHSLAKLYEATAQWEQALATYQQTLMAYEQVQQDYGGKILSIAQVYHHMGQGYEHLGQASAALNAYLQALEAYQNAGFPYGVLTLLERLASFSEAQGQSDRAQDYAQQAQQLRDGLE